MSAIEMKKMRKLLVKESVNSVAQMRFKDVTVNVISLVDKEATMF